MTPPSPPAERDIILLIDDAPDSVRMIAEALDEEGFTVLVATTGEVALERLRRVTPDAILLDICMPGIDGFETCRRIRAEPSAANVPILFMTGLAETERIVEGLTAGGVDYLIKPVMPDELVARLRAHLRVSREHNAALRALELSGLKLAFFSPDGALMWSTPGAQACLSPQRTVELGRQVAAHLHGRIDSTVFEAGLSSSGATTLGPATRSGLLIALRASNSASSAPKAALTGREVDVLEWVAKGKTNRDIGDILGMSPRTVNKHLEHIYQKLGVETRTAAVAQYERFTR